MKLKTQKNQNLNCIYYLYISLGYDQGLLHTLYRKVEKKIGISVLQKTFGEWKRTICA